MSDFLKEISVLLAGALDFRSILNQVAEIVVKNMKYTGVMVFVADKKNRELRPYAYRSLVLPDMSQTLGFSFYKLRSSYENPENLMGEAVKSGRITRGANLKDFISPPVSSVSTEFLEKAHNLKELVVVPILIGDEPLGGILTGTTDHFFKPNEIEDLKILASQVAVVLANAIAHERIVKKMERQNGFKKRKFDKPNIKFTLRITPRIEKYLSWKIQNTDRTKADYLREEVERLIDEDDEFEKFDEN